MIYLLLFKEFFKIGVFSFGGGYATLPFLYNTAEIYKWFSSVELSEMLAISSITPGPVGMNVATYAGFKTSGVFGSITATLAIVIPSFLLVTIVSRVLREFRENFYVQASLYALRPAAAALLGAVGLKLFLNSTVQDFNNPLSSLDFKALVLFIFLFILSFKTKKDPLLYLFLGGLLGVILHFDHIIAIFS